MSTRRVQILDPILANQIAAGEVVERPASAAKELIENAIDAGATEITVEVKEGGRALLRVADNGHGMSQADALLALERHATSKISVVDDLNRIHTLGFRGEALPSISSVSRFSLTTRAQGQLMATELQLEGGAQLKVAEVPGRVGTEVRVEDLFFNVPARRKFLKSSATETQLISEAFQRVALCYHQVACRLIKDGHVSFDYPRHSSLLERAEAMFGAQTAAQLHPVSSHGQLTIEGLISFPSHTYSAHRHGYTFINQRFVKDKLFLGAIQRAYGLRLPKGRFPFYVLKVQVNPSMVDVNVHPAKTEVRFVDEEVVLDLLTKAIRGAVQRFPETQDEEHAWSIVPGGLSFERQAVAGEGDEDIEDQGCEKESGREDSAGSRDSIERHRALIRDRMGGRVFHGERAPVSAERGEGEREDPRHHRDPSHPPRPEPSLLRAPSGRHEVMRVSQAELTSERVTRDEPLYEEAPNERSELNNQGPPAPQGAPSPHPLQPSTPALTPGHEPLKSEAPHLLEGGGLTRRAHPLPPLVALAQPGALRALRSVGRADAWWIQEASDGLLCTHLPSLYAQMILTGPQLSPVRSALHLTLSARQAEELGRRDLASLGVTVERFGGQSYRLTQLPSGFEEDWGERTLSLIEPLCSCAVGEERVTWAQLISQQSLSASARARALAWLNSEEGRALVERGEAPSCFVSIPWSSLLKQRGGLSLF